MCCKQDKTCCKVGKHTDSDASEQEHGAGSGTDKAGTRGVFFGNEACIFHVEQAAAADRIAGEYAQKDAERSGGGQF